MGGKGRGGSARSGREENGEGEDEVLREGSYIVMTVETELSNDVKLYILHRGC